MEVHRPSCADADASRRSPAPRRPSVLAAVAEADPIASLDRAQIVIANGVFEPALSDLEGIEGVTVESLAHVLATAPERVGRLFDDGDDTVMALNTALMQGGAVVTVAAGARPARPIEIVHLTAGVRAGVGLSRANVVDGGRGGLGALRRKPPRHGGRRLSGQCADRAAGRRRRLGDLGAASGRERTAPSISPASSCGSERASTLDHLAVNSGAALARWQGFVTVAGEDARIGFSGATMLSGTEHGDSTLVLNHAEPHGVSRELFKAAIDGRANGAFQGKIIVAPGAQKTDAKMMAKALLLSDEAEFASKPELEIFADDVQCGHGATSGQIDAAQLFYLLSRGIPRAEAEQLLIEAFLDDAIDAVGDEAIADALKGVVSAWLAKRGGR